MQSDRHSIDQTQNNMAVYLVTGGAGFIGSHLVEALIDAGHTVRIIDNLLTSSRDTVHPRAEFLQLDTRDFQAIRPAFEGVDGVFHMAAVPRVQESLENPIESHEHNLNSTLNVYVAAKEAGVRRIVYSASCAVYGEDAPKPSPEDVIPAPMSPYGIQKYVGELYARVFSLAYDIETVSLRYFNVYGPRMSEIGSYASVMSVFVRQKRQGIPLTITGDGEQTRDFTYITDVVRANILAMESPKVGAGEVLNIGAGRAISMNELAQLFGGPAEHIAPRLEPRDAWADIRRAEEVLGWKPVVSVEEGVNLIKSFYGIS